MSDELVSRTGDQRQSTDKQSTQDQPAIEQSDSEQPDSDRPIGELPSPIGRRNVRVFLLGKPEEVEVTMAELHNKQFGEVGLWSKPLVFPETQNQFTLKPGEVMRVYKRYFGR